LKFNNTLSRLTAAFFWCVLFQSIYLSISFDFKIVGSNISGISQIIPLHEDALNYLTEEVQYTVFKDGTAPVWSEEVGDFVSDAGHAHLCCDLV
tara:strand:- start:49 stop:330 length:282 start_codon:yes stop_codon:yes gene_type:complete